MIVKSGKVSRRKSRSYLYQRSLEQVTLISWRSLCCRYYWYQEWEIGMHTEVRQEVSEMQSRVQLCLQRCLFSRRKVWLLDKICNHKSVCCFGELRENVVSSNSIITQEQSIVQAIKTLRLTCIQWTSYRSYFWTLAMSARICLLSWEAWPWLWQLSIRPSHGLSHILAS